jgi:hypothetical protein
VTAVYFVRAACVGTAPTVRALQARTRNQTCSAATLAHSKSAARRSTSWARQGCPRRADYLYFHPTTVSTRPVRCALPRSAVIRRGYKHLSPHIWALRWVEHLEVAMHQQNSPCIRLLTLASQDLHAGLKPPGVPHVVVFCHSLRPSLDCPFAFLFSKEALLLFLDCTLSRLGHFSWPHLTPVPYATISQRAFHPLWRAPNASSEAIWYYELEVSRASPILCRD